MLRPSRLVQSFVRLFLMIVFGCAALSWLPVPLAAQEEAVDVAVTGVSISPASATVATGDSLVLAAALPIGERVAWSIVSGGGSLSPEGVFTAPAAPGSVTVRATAPSGSAEATLTVQPFAPFDAAPRPVASPSVLAFGPDGRLYLGTSYDSSAQVSGLWVADIRSGGQWQALAQFAPDMTDVNDMAFDADGNIFVTTQNGVWRQERGRGGWTKLNGGLPQGQEGFSANGLALINGLIYAGFGNGVVRRFSPTSQSWTQVGSGGLPSQELYTLTTDGAGRLFVGTRGAVFRYDNLNNSGATWLKHGNDLPEWVFELQYFGGRLYAGMRTGRISVFNGTAWVNSLDRGGFDMLVVGSALYATGSRFNGTTIMQLTGSGWQAVSRDNDHVGSEAWVFTADADGRIYTADREGRVYRGGPGRLPAKPRNNPAELVLAPGDTTLRVGTNLNLAATAQFSMPTGNSRLFLPLVQAANSGQDNTSVNDAAGVFWTTSNAAVATIDGRGIVTGLRPGAVTITAVSRGNMQVKRSLTITVNDPPRAVSGVQVTAAPTTSVAVGDSLFAYATVNGSNLGNQIGVTWSSSDPALADVTPNGRVLAKAPGQVRITAAAVADPGKTGSVEITVTPAPAGGDPNLGNWQNITANLPGNPERAGQSMWINALTFYNGQLFAGAWDEGGIWRRDGESWTQVGTKAGMGVPNNFNVTNFAIVGGQLYVAVGGAVFRYDGGTSWTRISNDMVDGRTSGVERVVSVNEQLYGLVNAGPARLFRYDGGTNWTQISNDLNAVWKSDGTATVGIAFGNGQFYVAPRLGKVFSLPLAGGTWADMSQGLPTEPGEPSAQSAITIAPDGTLFLVVNPAYNQIFRRAPGAGSWTQILGYSYGAGDIETLVHSSDTLWMGGNRQVLKVQGTARLRLDTYSASGVELPGRVKAIATDDDGRTIYVAARSETGLGQAIYRMVVNPNLPMQNNNLPASTASYLGNAPGPDEANAVEIGLDSGVVVAGRSERMEPCVACSEFGVSTTLLLGGGNGMLVRLDASGRQVRSVTRLGQQITDMEINRSSGEIALATDFGLALLNASADRVLWQRAVAGGVRRIAVGNDGTVAVINADVVTVYDSSGNQRGQRRFEGRFVEDVAVDAVSQSVFVGGYRNDRLPNGVPVQVAYLWSFDYGLTASKWQNWSYPGSALTGNEADTRLYRVAMGRDGLLYITGESAGGNGIYRWQPRTLGAPAPNVQFDAFNKIDMLRGAAHIGYYARLNPADGALLAGQFIVARLGDNFGNTFRPRAITADELGYVYVGGDSASAIDNRNFQQIAGKQVGPYSGDNTVLVAAPNLRARMYWTTWNGGNNSNAMVRGVAAGNGVAAAAFVATRGNLVVHEPLAGQGGPSAGISGGNPDAHFSVWPGFRR